MLKKFKMEYCKLVSTPMVTWCKLSKDDESLEVDQTLYRSRIGSLLYVITSRLDVMHPFRLVAWFQYAPKETHVQEIKMIYRYLKGTLDFGLWCPTCKYFTLSTYIDVDSAGSVDDIKNTSGGAFFLGNCLVSWLSNNQS